MRKMNKTFGVAAFTACILLTSCGETPRGDDAITQTEGSRDAQNGMLDSKAKQVKTIFHAVPSPMEMASMLKKAGAQYDASLLNDVKKVNDYSTSKSQALNLGIYGANLSYASVFNQNQESIIYLSCAKKLADNLGVSNAFDEDAIERMETNIDNRDSLLSIVSETYYMLDAYLKENGRDHISAMVIAAGWVEGLHISTSVATQSNNPSSELMERIADQKISLVNLIDLVEAYNENNQIDEILGDLQTLSELFALVVKVDQAETATTHAAGGTPMIGATVNSIITADGLEKLHATVSEIRTRYIS